MTSGRETPSGAGNDMESPPADGAERARRTSILGDDTLLPFALQAAAARVGARPDVRRPTANDRARVWASEADGPKDTAIYIALRPFVGKVGSGAWAAGCIPLGASAV